MGTFKFEETVNPADHEAVICAIVIYGLDGNDDIKIHGDVDGLRAFLFGGAGDDKIKGGKEEDILSGGLTDYDENNLAALCAIMDEWTRTDNKFQDRVNNVYDGSGDPGALNGVYTLETHVQISDGEVDDLKGGCSGSDWFTASEVDGDKTDKLKDGEAFWSEVESLFFET
jgi:hypothetical protein